MSTDNFNNDDGDFGDFGGFEAAEPIDPQEAQPLAEGVQASPSPWALLPGTASPAQTEVTPKGTNIVQQNAESQCVQGDLHVSANQASGDTDDKTFQGFQSCSQREDFETSATGLVPTKGFDANFSQIGASSDNTSKLVGAFDGALAEPDKRVDANELDTATPTEVAVKSASAPNATQTNTASSETKAKESVNGAASAQIKANNAAAKHLSRLQDKLRLTEQDRTKLQKELEEVQGLQKQLQSELVQLHEQTARYEQMQSKHALQLDEMRKAGHDALVLIVEEYKELCKTAVLQQQEASQRDFKEYLKEQAEKEEKKQKHREEEVSRVLESERSKFEKRLQDELSKMEEKHKTELKSEIVSENEKTEGLIKKAIESEKDKSTAAVEKAIQEERKRGQQVLEEQTTEFQKVLRDEREKSKRTLEKSLKEERDKLKESINDAVQQERDRAEKIQQHLRDQIKTELEHYVEKQRQEDLLVRRRQLTSMDLFLESARGQLKLLMNDADPAIENS